MPVTATGAEVAAVEASREACRWLAENVVLNVLIPLIRKGGVLHIHTFKKKDQIQGLMEKYRSEGLETELFRRCGNIAPGVYRWVFDLVKT